MKVQDHLKTEQLRQLEKMGKKDKMSRREVEELMNLNMQTLRRGHGGAKMRR